MTLADILQEVGRLSAEELRQLRERIDQIEGSPPAEGLLEALDELAMGLTADQLKQLEWAINVEHIEPWDETEWRD